MTRQRAVELSLLLVAGVITCAGYALASLGERSSVPADIVPFLLIVLGLLAAGHVAIRRLAPNADGTLFPIAALLNGLGYVFIARLDEDLAGLQATWTFVGMVAFIGTMVVVRDVRDLARYRYILALVGIALLLLPLLPVVGRTINGARLWLRIAGFTIQPGEFAKIALAIFFAGYLVEKRELLALGSWRVGPLVLPDPKHFGPLLGAWATSLIVMVFQRDLGSSLLFFTLFLVMLWIATDRTAYLVVGAVMFGGGAFFAWRTFTHVQQRVDIWLDPWQDVNGDGFQLVQSTFALASGGLTGSGPGVGSPGRIPAAETDFIFSVVGEELGLMGASAVLAAYLLMVGIGLRIAIRSHDGTETLLAAGLTTIIGVQAFLIIGGILRVLPLTGITLPFMSYGGSSLIANYVLLALLLRISGRTTPTGDTTTLHPAIETPR
jgi:cell division protein FtsW (lipid II flippase)